MTTIQSFRYHNLHQNKSVNLTELMHYSKILCIVTQSKNNQLKQSVKSSIIEVYVFCNFHADASQYYEMLLK